MSRHAYIVVHYNNVPLLTQLLDSIDRFDQPASGRMVIVVDSFSSVETRAEVTALLSQRGFGEGTGDETAGRIFMPCATNVGYSRGNNLGIKRARELGCEIALIANPDTKLVDATTVPLLLTAIGADGSAVGAFPEVIGIDGQLTGNQQGPYPRANRGRIYFGNSVVEKLAGPFRRRVQTSRTVRPIFTSLGCFFAVHTARFEEIGGFDEEFFLYYEEQVLGERSLRKGYHFLWVPIAQIYHAHDYTQKFPDWETLKLSEALFFRKYKGIGSVEFLLYKSIKYVRLRLRLRPSDRSS